MQRLAQSWSSWRFPIEGIDLVGSDAARRDEGIVWSWREPVSQAQALQGRDAVRLSVAHAHPPPGRIVTNSAVEQVFTIPGPA